MFVKSHMECNVQYLSYNDLLWFCTKKSSGTKVLFVMKRVLYNWTHYACNIRYTGNKTIPSYLPVSSSILPVSHGSGSYLEFDLLLSRYRQGMQDDRIMLKKHRDLLLCWHQWNFIRWLFIYDMLIVQSAKWVKTLHSFYSGFLIFADSKIHFKLNLTKVMESIISINKTGTLKMVGLVPFMPWFSVPEYVFRSASEPLQWRHNGRYCVSNHQPHDCLLNHLFRHRSKKTSKLRVSGLCVGNSPVTSEFPTQMASNTENVSILMTSSWQETPNVCCF